ncbi:MAG: hypothetical protein QGG67_06075 [Gammaproteobacteria bacterium]|nr:hypothetical protein [Gammaproteobacteria bacterium]
MSKISMFVLVIGLVIGITGVTLFLYGMNSKAEIPVASISESTNSDENATSERFKVRGDWEVTVSDPDGSNPVVHNFQNTIHEDAFDIVSRSLLPLDQEKKADVRFWRMNLWDHNQVVCFLSTDPEGEYGDNPIGESGEWHQLLARLIPKDETNDAIWSPATGLRLTGSCLADPTSDFGDEINIDRIEVGVDYHVNDSNQGSSLKPGYYSATWEFASKEFTEENALVVGSPGHTIGVTVDFTFE